VAVVVFLCLVTVVAEYPTVERYSSHAKHEISSWWHTGLSVLDLLPLTLREAVLGLFVWPELDIEFGQVIHVFSQSCTVAFIQRA
jgi:hypothetical protein